MQWRAHLRPQNRAAQPTTSTLLSVKRLESSSSRPTRSSATLQKIPFLLYSDMSRLANAPRLTPPWSSVLPNMTPPGFKDTWCRVLPDKTIGQSQHKEIIYSQHCIWVNRLPGQHVLFKPVWHQWFRKIQNGALPWHSSSDYAECKCLYYIQWINRFLFDPNCVFE